MDVSEVMAHARDAMTVRRVFGEPYEKDGVTVIPVARVMGGAGGGGGEGGEGTDRPSGSGAGYGLVATPAGVYVIRGEEVRWHPALDVNRLILGAQIVAVIALLVVRSIARRPS